MPDYINIRTAQNVEINYKLAGLGNRVLAQLIDMLIMFGFSVAMLFLIDGLGISGMITSFFFLPLLLYTLLFEILNNGQTPGKSITRSKVVSLDGTTLSLGQIIIRWMMQLVDIWLLVGLPGILSIASGDKQQRLGDKAADTIVVSLKTNSSFEKTSFVKVEKGYQPIYAQAHQLSEQDIRILKTVLTDKSDNRYALMSKASAKIEDIIQEKKSTSSQEFLKTIVKDYNYYLHYKDTEIDEEEY